MGFLKQGSIQHEEGDQVVAGEPIGQCGNSGAATTPRVRVYLIRDIAQPLMTEGLPLRFDAIQIEGAGVARDAMPLGGADLRDFRTGQTVSHVGDGSP